MEEKEIVDLFDKKKRLTFNQQIKKLWNKQDIVNKVITIILLIGILIYFILRVF